MLFKQHYRLYIIILIIFLGDSALSQNERSVPAFSEDHFLLYDTMFIDFNLPAIKMQAKENFDEDVVRLRLDSLNKLGESVVRIGVGDDGSGVVDLRDKHGYKK